MQESSFSEIPLDQFFSEEYDFPNKNDGGLLGSSVDDLPPSLIHDHKQQRHHRQRRKKSKKNSKKKNEGRLQEAEDIYRLGPSLEGQWWRVEKDRKKKRKKHRKRRHHHHHHPPHPHYNDQRHGLQEGMGMGQSSSSLPELNTPPMEEISSAILTKNRYSNNDSTPPTHLYDDHHDFHHHDFHHHDQQHRAPSDTPPRLKDTTIISNAPPTTHSYDDQPPLHHTAPQSQPRRSNGRKPTSILNVPYGQEALDLDPPIMARTVDPYVMRYFALLDIDGVGSLRKRHLIHGVRHSWKIREYLLKQASAPMKSLCRRPGFASGIASLKTSDPTLVTYPEFRDYCLGLTERREAELALSLKLERLQRKRIRKQKRIQREEKIRAAKADLEATSALGEAKRQIEIQMERTQAECKKEKEMLGEFRNDAEKGVNTSKRFASSIRKKSTNQAMDMIKEGAERARDKEQAALELDEKLRNRRTRQELAMRKVTNNAKTKVLEVTIDAKNEATLIIQQAQEEAEKIRQLGHEKAVDEQKEIDARKLLAKDIVAAARQEADAIRARERITSDNNYKNQMALINTLKNQCLEECGSLKKNSEMEGLDIKKRYEDAGQALLEQIKTEQELWRARALEEKEAAVRKARGDMVLVLDRAKQKSEQQIAAAMEKAKDIVADGKKRAHEIYAKAKADGENQEALNKLKGSVRMDMEQKLKAMEKKQADKERLEAAAKKRNRRKRSVAMGKDLQSKF